MDRVEWSEATNHRIFEPSRGNRTTDSESPALTLAGCTWQELGTRSLPTALNPVTGVTVSGRI